MLRVAFLDDYTHMAEAEGAWDTIVPAIDLTVFDEPFADTDAVAARLAPFDVVVLNRERTPFPAALIARLPLLRYIVSFGARNASLDLAAAKARGIPVSGTVDESAAVAELAWGLIVALARGIVREDRAVRSGVWQEGVGIELAGRRLGLLGLGRIGGQIARIGAGVRHGARRLEPQPDPGALRRGGRGAAGGQGRADRHRGRDRRGAGGERPHAGAGRRRRARAHEAGRLSW